ncbi:hypothetical protein EOD41_17730 [Mucilaginibacter limnophilus]|uniref:Uncharacterized protein n=1 Tax=Mucilaginibacter limnophilus TaxID=1932778 RepID=A0A3S2V6C8_9SPHI|nr:hypothetical protein [Mucilaginibacter limnophilus]RVT98212.1 hypothetical protein EOD41_17730 [Mucilaginibacter limnophilus]
MKNFLLVAKLLAVSFTSCKKDKTVPKSHAVKEEELIKAYLLEKKLVLKKIQPLDYITILRIPVQAYTLRHFRYLQ